MQVKVMILHLHLEAEMCVKIIQLKESDFIENSYVLFYDLLYILIICRQIYV